MATFERGEKEDFFFFFKTVFEQESLCVPQSNFIARYFPAGVISGKPVQVCSKLMLLSGAGDENQTKPKKKKEKRRD